MGKDINRLSVADIEGEWKDPGLESGLILRCKNAWNTPLIELTNGEMATFLRQKIAVDHILTLARQRLANGFDDDSEMYEGELHDTVAMFSGR